MDSRRKLRQKLLFWSIVLSLVLSMEAMAETGGFSFPSEQIVLVTSPMNQELCLQNVGFDWFEDTCYECSGKIARRNEKLVCMSCIEGYALEGEKCKAINPQESNILWIDKYLTKFFPDNPLLGLLITVFGLSMIIYGVAKRNMFKDRFLKFKKR